MNVARTLTNQTNTERNAMKWERVVIMVTNDDNVSIDEYKVFQLYAFVVHTSGFRNQILYNSIYLSSIIYIVSMRACEQSNLLGTNYITKICTYRSLRRLYFVCEWSGLSTYDDSFWHRHHNFYSNSLCINI